MSLIYNALKEQDFPSDDGNPKVVSGAGFHSLTHQQSKSQPKLWILMIIGGLLISSVITVYYLRAVKGTGVFPVTEQTAVSHSSASRKGLEITVAKEQIIAASDHTPIQAQVQPLALAKRVVKQPAVADKIIVPGMLAVKKKMVIREPPQRSAAAGIITNTASSSTAPAQKIVTKADAESATPTVRHETVAKIRRTRNYLREVGEIVAQLKVSMRGKDTTHTETLLQSLEHRMGADSVIVLRLRAYWLLQQQKNTLAQKAYQQLLIQQPDDMAANLNMALLELRAGNQKQASERLSRMAVVYPDSDRVREFKRQLRDASGR